MPEKKMINWTHIIIHHSQSRDRTLLDYEDIKRWHVEGNGWLDIGYHYIIEKINNSYLALVGRSLQNKGAHCKGMNNKAIGICFVGNYDIAIPDENMYITGRQLISDLSAIFKILPENILPHRSFSDKTCPGKNFDMSRLI